MTLPCTHFIGKIEKWELFPFSLRSFGAPNPYRAITSGEKKTGAGWPAFEERSFEAFRSYYAYLPKGEVQINYTVRLNNVGSFTLPPSRVEALYAPEMFGEAPNARVKVEAAR